MAKKVTYYEAEDGTKFDSLEACENYEKNSSLNKFLEKYNLSQVVFDKMTQKFGAIDVDYILDFGTDKVYYMETIEKILHKLANGLLNDNELRVAIKALTVYCDLYHSVNHDY